MKRIVFISHFLLVFSLFATPVVFASGTYSGGDGLSEGTAFQIADAADMQEIGANPDDWDKYFILTGDVDLSLFTGTQFNIIGDSSAKFTGSFDGGEHTIDNFTYSSTGVNNIGMFGYTDSGCVIKNLRMTNVNVDAGTGKYVGGLVGYNLAGMIENCYVEGSVSGNSYVGGVTGFNTGYFDDRGTISDSSANVAVTCSEQYAGGLTGENNTGIITSSYSAGSVTGQSYLGGLVGFSTNSTISDCYSTSSVIGESLVAGFVGRNETAIDRCYSIGSVVCNVAGNPAGGFAGSNGGTINGCFWDVEASGQTGSRGGKGITTSQMKTVSTFKNAEWHGSEWVMDDGADYPRLALEGSGYPAIPAAEAIPLQGSGSQADPYQVWNASELALVSWYVSALDKHFVLMADVDASGTEFHPIGDLGIFTGGFDGRGHVISNLTINIPNGVYVGLFGNTTGCEFRDLGLEDVDIHGGTFVGGVAGRIGCDITGCYVTGSVSASGSVVGGLAGTVSGTTSKCFTTCTVTGDSYTGGLVGLNGRTVVDCYSTSKVVGGEDYVGGLVGDNWYFISNSYSTGEVTSVGGNVGGLVGSNRGSITNSFWDVETSGLSTSAGGTGKTTAEMQSASTFTDALWDFVGESVNGDWDVWRLCVDGSGYPRFAWEYSRFGDFVCGDGVDMDDFAYFAARDLCDGCGGIFGAEGGVVDSSILSMIANAWLSEGCSECDGGDVSGDGKVDLADYSKAASEWQCFAPVNWDRCDLDGDGVVGDSDFDIWISYWLE